jgi:hypothetical protein
MPGRTEETTRQAGLRDEDTATSVSLEYRRARSEALERLIELFANHDADEEIRQLKAQDEGF